MPPCQSPLVKPLMKNTTGTITSMKRINSQLTRSTPLSKLVMRPPADDACAPGSRNRSGRRWRRRPPCRAADDGRAHEADVGQRSSAAVRRHHAVDPLGRRRASRLLDRQRFARQRRLADEQVLRESSRTSAGTMSPADKCTTSPGTIRSNGSPVAAGRRRRRHALIDDTCRRVTVAVVRTRARNASAAFDDRTPGRIAWPR